MNTSKLSSESIALLDFIFATLLLVVEKSYTIGKLTCEYYPQHFDRIVILCVQNKLVEGMNREIEQFVNTKHSLIKSTDILIIEKNADVIKKAIENGSFQELIDQLEYNIGALPNNNVRDLTYGCNRIKKTFGGVKNLICTQGNNNNELISNQITEAEFRLRNDVRNFFEVYKKHLKQTKNRKNIDINYLLKTFPALAKAYPQVDYKRKRVLLMTVHKAMYGIDPIVTEKISLHNITEKDQRTLVFFDESDQAAIAMRNTIIEQAIENSGGNKRFAKGYNSYLQYKQLIDMPEHLSDEYHGELLYECLKKANQIIKTNWSKVFGDTVPYKNIFLGDIEDLENYRRGVFFSGSALKLNVSKAKDSTHSYICFRKGERQFKLFHAANDTELKENFDYVVPMDKFLSLIVRNTTAIKACKVSIDTLHFFFS